MVDGPFREETFCLIIFLLAMASEHKRFARDGCLYTQEEFFNWYGVQHGQLLWDQAPVALPDSTCDDPASVDMRIDESIVVCFRLLSGAKACKNFEGSSEARVTARDLQQHIREHSARDDLHAIDWHSKLVLPGQPSRELDFAYDRDVLGLVEVRTMLAQTQGVVTLHVIREPLWNCLI